MTYVIRGLVLAGVAWVAACGDDVVEPPLDASSDAPDGPGDAAVDEDGGPDGGDGGIDAHPDGHTDAGADGSDASADAASDSSVDAALPGDVIATDVCVTAGDAPAVAVSALGTVAIVTCGESPRVLVHDLADGSTIDLAPAEPDHAVAFSPDGTHVVYGDDTSTSIRVADGSSDAVDLGPVVAYRFIEREDVDEAGVFHTSLIVASTDGDAVRIVARDADPEGADPYTSERLLVTGPDVLGRLGLVSGNGQNLFIERTELDSSRYYRVSTGELGVVMGLPFGPDEGVMVVQGLGNTHGLVVAAGELTFRELESVVNSATLAAAVPSTSDVFVREGLVYFVDDGNPTRRERSVTPGDPEILADADATDLALTPATTHVLYPSTGSIHSVDLSLISAPVTIIEAAGAITSFDPVFDHDGGRVAVVTDAGALMVAPTDQAGQDVELDTGVVSGSTAFAGATLFWLRDDGGDSALRRSDDGGSPSTIAPRATAYWLVPGDETVLYFGDGELRVL
jgi:hypothetical protein